VVSRNAGDIRCEGGIAPGFSRSPEMEGWQQFVVHARDERGDGVSDYMIEVLTEKDNTWTPFEEMYVDVHAYGPDPSFRCFQIRLPKGILAGNVPLKVRIHASTGTELMGPVKTFVSPGAK
jgi:hypothetical protein